MRILIAISCWTVVAATGAGGSLFAQTYRSGPNIAPPSVGPVSSQAVTSFDTMTTLAPKGTSTIPRYLNDLRPGEASGQDCRQSATIQACLECDPFADFISPITNPFYFEDPRNLTEFRGIFMQQKVPYPAGCGEFQVYAGQVRASLSERMSLLVNKAGYVTSGNSFVDDGWLDLSAGLKWNLLQDADSGRLLSTGITFEVPTGEASALQGNGDGELHTFVSGATRLGECAHWMSGVGARIPMNSTDESQSIYWSNHWDYRVSKRFYLLTELNWYHWTKAGQDGCTCYEGLDLFNFGTPGVAGNDIVTSAMGAKYITCRGSEIGVAFEFPLTERRDILDNRITADWIVRF